MAETYKTEGVILKRWDYKEQDRMVRVLTKDRGKITTRAIGARKITSKLSGHLEPFIHTDLFIARSKTIDIIAGSNTIHCHAQLRHSLLHGAIASYACEVIDRWTEERHRDSELFEHVRRWLTWCDDHPPRLSVLIGGVVQTLGLLGYRLELFTCARCQTPIPAQETRFHYQLWSVLCPSCAIDGDVIVLPVDTIKVFRFLLQNDFDTMAKLQLSSRNMENFFSVVHSLMDYHLHKELRSEALLRQIAFIA